MKVKSWGIILVVLASLLMSISVSGADMKEPVGNVAVSFMTPTVDGTIAAIEYAAHVILNDSNMKALTTISYEVPTTHQIELYFAWDYDCLYVAYNVTDPTPAWSGTELNGQSAWLFNGDNIQFFADFGPTLAYRDLADTERLGGRRAPLFATGVNDDDTHFVLHQLVVAEAILNLAPNAPASAFAKTATGWAGEFSIPWSMLMADMTEKTGVSLSEANLGNGSKINCFLIYNDYEQVGVIKNMFGTSSTGYEDPFDWQPEIFGINLTLIGADRTAETVPPSENAPETTLPAQTTLPDTDVTQDNSAVTSDDKLDDDHGDKEENKLIPILIVAGIIVTAVVIGIIVVKKKK